MVSLYSPTGVNKAFSGEGTGLFSKPGIMIYSLDTELRPLSEMDQHYELWDYFKRTNSSYYYYYSLIRLIQNNNRNTLHYYSNVAEDEDLFLEGDDYLLTWEDEEIPCRGITVDKIYQDNDGLWCADLTLN